MYRDELLAEIERLRGELYCLKVTASVDYEKMLEASQALDRLIVEYHRNVNY